MDFITDLQQRLSEHSAEMLMSYTGDVFVKSLSEMETRLKQMLHELGHHGSMARSPRPKIS